MGSIDSGIVLLICGRSTPMHNGIPQGAEWGRVPVVELPARPGRDDVDPVLVERSPRRLVVAGTDADLAAVLVRLLRTEQLHVEVGYLPSSRRSAAAAAWGLPTGRSAAAAVALSGRAHHVPLIRDDVGSVLVGRGEIRRINGEAYCDEHLILRGFAQRLVVVPGVRGVTVDARRRWRAPDGRLRPVPVTARAGRGSAVGRAVQIGGMPFRVSADGVDHPRETRRWAWYRHTEDWLLVRP